MVLSVGVFFQQFRVTFSFHAPDFNLWGRRADEAEGLNERTVRYCGLSIQIFDARSHRQRVSDHEWAEPPSPDRESYHQVYFLHLD